MHLSEDILHVCALAHACIMHYRVRVCFARLQSNGADLALVSQNCCVPLLVCPVFPRQFRCITSVCLTYLSTAVYFLEKSAACGVSLSDRERRPRFVVGGPTCETEIHVRTLSCQARFSCVTCSPVREAACLQSAHTVH